MLAVVVLKRKTPSLMMKQKIRDLAIGIHNCSCYEIFAGTFLDETLVIQHIQAYDYVMRSHRSLLSLYATASCEIQIAEMHDSSTYIHLLQLVFIILYTASVYMAVVAFTPDKNP